MLLSDFQYHLPAEHIAQHPVDPRDHSRLMVMDRKTGDVSHRHFYDLPEYLTAGDALVFNDTRVIPARLRGVRADTGGSVEIFLLNRLNHTDWATLVKPGKRARTGITVSFGPALSCEIVGHTNFGGRIVRFSFDGSFEAVLDKLGETPLPPYIHEQLSDSERYQTVYARERGSAAAPTAGLHFTPELLSNLEKRGVKLVFITLHVGLGTFRPVHVQNIVDHIMHKEFYSVSANAAQIVNDAKKQGRRIIGVGTTSVRTLETAGRSGFVASGSGWTDIFIYPGFCFRVVDAMVTNFHLPESTLLMLTSAFAGRDHVMAAYCKAVEEQYRFFSFGDAMLIL